VTERTDGTAMDPQASDGGQAAAQTQKHPLEWRFAQVFGERAAGEDVQEGAPTTTRSARFVGALRLGCAGAIWIGRDG
jgi:hypothetical protein